MNKATKGIIIGVSVLAVVGIVVFMGLKMTEEHLVLDTDTVTVELGSEKYLNKDDFIKKKMSDKAKKAVKVESKVTEDSDVGEYDVTFSYKTIVSGTEQKKATLIIEDTTSPSFMNQYDTIYVEQDAQDFNIENYFTVQEHSDYTISMQVEEFDLKKIGLYVVKILATDEYNNQTDQTVSIKVVPTKDVWEGKEALTAYTDGDVPISDKTREKINKGTLAMEDLTLLKKDRVSHEKEDSKDEEGEDKDKDKEEDKDEDKDKDKDKEEEEGTGEVGVRDGVMYLPEKCLDTYPSDGNLTEAEAITSAMNYLKATGLGKTHTYVINHGTSCGLDYFNYSIVPLPVDTTAE